MERFDNDPKRGKSFENLKRNSSKPVLPDIKFKSIIDTNSRNKSNLVSKSAASPLEQKLKPIDDVILKLKESAMEKRVMKTVKRFSKLLKHGPRLIDDAEKQETLVKLKETAKCIQQMLDRYPLE